MHTHRHVKMVDDEKERDARFIDILWRRYDSRKLVCAPKINVNLINPKQQALT